MIYIRNIYESDLAFKILINCLEEITPTEIIKKTNKSKQVVSKYLKNLMNKDLIECKIDENEHTKNTISNYLRVLRKKQLVSYRKVGKQRFYKVNKTQLKAYMTIRKMIYQKRMDEVNKILELIKK